MTVLAIVTFVASVPAAYAHFHDVCPGSGCAGDWRIEPEDASALEKLGLSLGFYAAYNTALNVIYTIGFFAVGTLIFLKKPDDWMALFTSLTLITYGTNYPIELAEAYPAWSLPVAFISYLGGVGFFIFFYLFPNGRFVPRWTRALAAIWIAYQVPVYFFPYSPFSGSTWPPLLKALLWLGFLSTLVVAQVYRYVRVSGPVEREQARWLVSGLAAVIAVVVGFSLVILPFPTLVEPGIPGVLYTFFSRTAYYLALLLVPLSIAIAILRHRLWDIDIIINRTLVYGALTASIVGIYALIVGSVGSLLQARDNFLVSLLAAGFVAILFAPLREGLQRGVNRLMYGERDNPYGVLSRLGRRLEGTLEPKAVLPTIIETVAGALKLPYAAIAMKREDGFEVAAAHGSPTGEEITLPLNYSGETIGQLVLAPRSPGETFTPADRRLLEDLARQAEVAVQAVRLNADLQRSRERLVSAREEERRRLRRDLHDGLGPTLATLSLGLDVSLKMLENDPQNAKALLREMKSEAQNAVADIRRVIYGLRPPALDDLGLVAAIREQASKHGHLTDDLAGRAAEAAGKNGLVFSVEAPEKLPPLPAAVEVACYMIAQEAITNVVRHAEARICRVRLSIDDARKELELEVADDGIGLPEGRRAGVGMSSMTERAAELGGTCAVTPDPVGGTRVVARLPLFAEEEE